MTDLPQWAIDELKELFAKCDGQWKIARPLAKSIWKKLGWKPSVQTIYDVLNNISPEGRVAPCGKEKAFDGFWGGYRFCGRAGVCPCAASHVTEKARSTNLERYGVESPLASGEIREKRKATMLERYGVENTASSPVLRDKMAQTVIDRYGVDNIAKIPEAKDKYRNTMVERHGVENPSKSASIQQKKFTTNVKLYGGVSPLSSAEVRDKGKETMLARYGVEHAQQAPEVKDQTRQTNRERYGVDFLQQSPEMRDKSRQTLRERYGVESPLQNPEFAEKRRRTTVSRYGVEHAYQSQTVRDKAAQTNLERYGVQHASHRHISQPELGILLDKNRFCEEISTKSASTLASHLGVDTTTIYKYCKDYGIVLPKSSYEREIATFLEECGVEYISNTRSVVSTLTGKLVELDFFIPRFNIAIEFNGLYYHSTRIRDDLYHRDKYNACREAGIMLLMVNEDEWNARSHSVKSRIRHLLKKSQSGTAARKLSLVEIGSREANSFFDHHHIQGKTGSISYAVGAYDNGILVGAMAFNKQRGTGEDELIRFCSDGDSHPGMFSKMFRYSVREKQYDRIISFADLRYSLGDVYIRNGFDLVDEINPDYRYVVGKKTYHKSSYSKSKLAKINPEFANMTEREATQCLGIHRIYDCGKLKFVWNQKR